MDVAADIQARAEALSKESAAIRERQRQIGMELLDCLAAARLFGVELQLPDGVKMPGALTVRDNVMRRLAEAGAAGVTAADLNKEYPHLHPKTVGMTLYRLSQEKFCKRVGTRLWVINTGRDWTDEDPGQCSTCRKPYELVRPGKSQPTCDC